MFIGIKKFREYELRLLAFITVCLMLFTCKESVMASEITDNEIVEEQLTDEDAEDVNIDEIMYADSSDLSVRFEYGINSDGETVTIKGCICSSDVSMDLEIPGYIDGYKVTTINSGCSISECFKGKLIIPDTVTTIKESAFEGYSGFTGDLIIPNSVTHIGRSSFEGCSGFTGNLVLPDSITTIPSYAFLGCSGFTGDLIIPNTVTSIERGAFYKCSGFTGSLIVPNTVTNLERDAFIGCSGFTNVRNDSDKKIQLAAEEGKVWQNIATRQIISEISNGSATKCNSYVYDGYSICVKDGEDTATIYKYKGKIGGNLTIPDIIGGYTVTGIADEVFRCCTDFTGRLTIPNTVTHIGSEAFYACYGLTGNLIIPDKLTFLGRGAFEGCSGLTGELIIPDTLTSIEGSAFSGCTGLSGNLIIPDTVTEIGNAAFSLCSGFTGDLMIPDSVTEIGDSAFYYCSGFNGKLKLPSSISKIGYRTFLGCSGLTGELTIPDTVTSIEEAAFFRCSSLSGNLTIPDTVTSMGKDVFWECSGFTGNLKLPNSLTLIKDYTFYGCSGLSGNLVIPDTVTSIGDNAFRGCKSLTGQLILPDKLTCINRGVFAGCSGLTGNLTISNKITSIGDTAFALCSGFTGDLIIPDSITSIKYSTFSGCSGLDGKLLLPDSIKTIDMYSFSGCSGLSGNLIIPDSVTQIGRSAFNGCSGFTGSLKIPYSLTNIEQGVFENCSGFTGSLVIPDTVTRVENAAFAGCSGFDRSLIIPSTLIFMEDAFDKCDGFVEINNNTTDIFKLPVIDGKFWKNKKTGKTITEISKGTAIRSDYDEGGSYSISVNDDGKTATIIKYTGVDRGDLTIPDTIDGYTITEIGDNVFLDCSGFTGNLRIPDTVTKLGSSSFDGCSGLSGSLKIPEKITHIGKYAFRNCRGLSGSLTIPDNVESIERGVFSGCSGFGGKLTIPNTVASIGAGAFKGCSGLSGDLTIPETVSSIGKEAFSGCRGFTGDLKIPNTITSVSEGTFRGCSGFTNLIIPETVSYIGGEAFLGCSGFTGNLTIPSTIKTVNKYVFAGCSGFTGNLVIPETVNSIAEYAFLGCSGFTGDITIHDNVKSVGTDAFGNCKGITCIYNKSKNDLKLGQFNYDRDILWKDSKTGEIIRNVKSGTAIKAEYYTPEKYTVSFNALDHGTVLTPYAEVTCCSRLIAPEVLPDEGYKFDGWYKDEKCIYFWDFAADRVTSDITLYAKWTECIEPKTKPFNVLFKETNKPYYITTYDGRRKEPEVYVTDYNGNALLVNTDYTVRYANNINATENMNREATVTVVGKGAYSGKIVLNFEIRRKYIADKDVVAGYVEKMAKQSVEAKLSYNGMVLKSGEYTVNVEYNFQKYVPESLSSEKIYTFEIEGNKNYYGKRKMQVSVVDTNKKNKFVVLQNKNKYTYNGKSLYKNVMDSFEVYSAKDKKLLREGIDYIMTYPSELSSDRVTPAGKYPIAFTGIAGYEGQITKSIDVLPAKTAEIEIKDIKDKIYIPSGVTISQNEIVVRDATNDIQLVQGIDYIVKYANNKTASDIEKGKCAKAKIFFMGNYTGHKTVDKDFVVKKADLGDMRVLALNMYYKKSGIYKAPVYVEYNHELIPSSEYTVSYYLSYDSKDESKCVPMNSQNKFELVNDETEKEIVAVVSSKEKNITGSAVKSFKISKTLVDLSKIRVRVFRDINTIKSLEYTGDETLIGNMADIRLGDFNQKKYKYYALVESFEKDPKTGKNDWMYLNGQKVRFEFFNNVRTGNMIMVILSNNEQYAGYNISNYKIVSKSMGTFTNSYVY